MRPHTSLKVALGYALLALVLVAAVAYVRRQTRALDGAAAAEQTAAGRRDAVARLVGSLFTAENLGQAAVLEGYGAYPRYEAAVGAVLAAVDSLDAQLADTLQRARLDTLRRLVVDKMESTARLLAVRADRPLDAVYARRIAALRAAADSLQARPAAQQRVVEVERTYTVERTRRTFLGRLADAFRRQRTDTTEVRRDETVHYGDTLAVAPNVADSVAAALDSIRRDAARAVVARRGRTQVREQAVREAGVELTRRIGQLLRSIEQTERQWRDAAVRREAEARRSAARTMGGLALVAVVLALGLTVWVARDIRRAARYRRELEEARGRAEDLLAQREQLMLTVTHDIKAPVSSILGYLELLGARPSAEQTARYVASLQSAADHLSQLVAALLDYHRLEAGKMDLRPVDFDPGRLFVEAVEALRPAAARKGLELRAEVDASLCRTFRGDAFRLRQIADNLLTNALKFTDSGGITLRAAWADGGLTFSVADTGCGMTVLEQQRIFDAFTRLASAQGQEGVGLGLAITKKLTDLLGGRLDVASRRGEGSTFTVSVPLEAAGAAVPAAEAEPAPAVGALRVALVDDDRLQLRLTEEMLAHLSDGKARVTAFGQPDGLLEGIGEGAFDVVLTDIQMPAMGGFELLRRLRALGGAAARVPVVAVTARSDMAETDLQAEGFAACLHKPFSLRELAAVLARSGASPLPADGADGPGGAAEEPAPVADGQGGAPTDPFAALTAFAGDDAAAAAEILRTFRDETARHAAAFAAALAAKDKAEVCRLAHKLLPTFTLIGSPAAADLRLLEGRRGESAWTAADDVPAGRVAEALRATLRCLDSRTAAGDGAPRAADE